MRAAAGLAPVDYRTADRLAQRRAFLGRCIARAVPWGGALTWPTDQAAILALGIPCSDCVSVVYALEGRRRHTIRVVLVGPALHWSDGITAHCAAEVER